MAEPQRPAKAPAPPGRVESLARDIYLALVTQPAAKAVGAAHLAYDAVQKAKAFYDAADEHLK